MRVHTSIPVIAAVAVVAVAAPAEARSVHFHGPHPIAARYGGGYCYIEVPHMHVYPPDHPALYQQVNDEYVFTGDPTPFGYDGDKHKFYGPHPIPVAVGGPVYCYIDGPHFHPFAATGPEYKIQGDVAFYVGPFAPSYEQWRPRRAPAVNAEYRPYVSFRPVVVDVRPPPEWRGEIYVPPAVVAAPGVAVGVPGVAVVAPGVAVSAPGVVVAPPGVAVGVRAPGVGFVAPGVRGGVVVGAPGVVVGGGYRHDEGWHRGEREHEHGHDHHDNGWHRGEEKHGHR